MLCSLLILFSLLAIIINIVIKDLGRAFTVYLDKENPLLKAIVILAVRKIKNYKNVNVLIILFLPLISLEVINSARIRSNIFKLIVF